MCTALLLPNCRDAFLRLTASCQVFATGDFIRLSCLLRRKNASLQVFVELTINYGMVVLFLAGNETSYYDDQKIYVSSDMRVMQVGTFRYMTREEMVKTVPVVAIMDK